jgi:hypothetical protein
MVLQCVRRFSMSAFCYAAAICLSFNVVRALALVDGSADSYTSTLMPMMLITTALQLQKLQDVHGAADLCRRL